MPSLLQTGDKVLKSMMVEKESEKAAAVPMESTWSQTQAIISVMGNAHLSVDGDPPSLTLVNGIKHPEKEMFIIATTVVAINDKLRSLIYFSHRQNDVTYYVTARGNHVVLEAFKSEPGVDSMDGRLFEMTMNKRWCQFESFRNHELYLCHDETGFCLKTQTEKEGDQFNFDLLPWSKP